MKQKELIGREIEMAIENEYLGLKVFKDDPKLLDEVTYNGCETYKFPNGSTTTAHYYTELTTKSTFTITNMTPTVEEIRRKIAEVHKRFNVKG